MGGCFSGDVEGGKQAIGGVQQRPTSSTIANNAAHNDAVDFFFRSRGQYPLFSQIELTLSALNLLDCDITSKSDPMAVMYLRKKDGRLEEIGRTEVILNSLNPKWIEKITVSFQFEAVQTLVFHVYDVDTRYHNVPVKTLKLKDQDFLGEATCVLSEIMTRPNRTVTLTLTGNVRAGVNRNLGTLSVQAEETVASKTVAEINFRCVNLDNKDLFSKSDPFLRISRIVETSAAVPICRTEVVDNNLNPMWRPVCLTMQQFGSKDTPLVIECFDFNNSGNHELIGKTEKSVAELERLCLQKEAANFVYPSLRGNKVLKGQLIVDRYVEKVQYSFLDYISSGFELNFMVAVDFTASNGDPRTPSSLHYIDPSGRLNSYQQAIMEVGEVIQFYDSDKRFPAWGFGGRTSDGSVSHAFNLNGASYGDEVVGVEGIMAAYASALRNVALAGPTLFSHVVDKAAHTASHSLSQNSPKYFVLLIITDGVLTDMAGTIDALVRASDLPLSVLIVGVGSTDFKQMEMLDADNGRRLESSTGRIATRDIVQFVPMKDIHSGQVSVVQALLEELPGQFLSYVRSRKINPVGAPAS
ncbi:C2 domain [Arabidopsis thaliana x Arabidopsis arenosa]|uniref:C2 domain n=1 Tax=Arabidopsis thaliana x Arabidopsis arenosa TaxID=1240361 RepID=A0A8T2BYW5_9BRAS|nr:C2 domain [Arabidopsis thaliana x Arabidopsis arenosa]KAG7591166.1 C2 domain [Arabidopsis thaliana x Arabidopsis arenosa]